jgi:hypothetical protein
MFVAATHGLLHSGARAKLDMPAVREVFVTNTVDVPEKDWRKAARRPNCRADRDSARMLPRRRLAVC